MEWISVKVKLPEPNIPVIVITENEAYQPFGNIQIAYNIENKWLTKDTELDKVTHWMPLPPLPDEQFEAIKIVADNVADLYAPADRSLESFSFDIKVEGIAYTAIYKKDEEGYWVFAEYRLQ